VCARACLCACENVFLVICVVICAAPARTHTLVRTCRGPHSLECTSLKALPSDSSTSTGPARMPGVAGFVGVPGVRGGVHGGVRGGDPTAYGPWRRSASPLLLICTAVAHNKLQFKPTNHPSGIQEAMDENELRRKALESMMRKKGEPKGTGASKEDGEVEEEGGTPGAAASTKSKWADDEDTAASPQQGAEPLLTPACQLPPRLLLLLRLLPS